MAQILTICRTGREWAFRDVTGAEYGHSLDIDFVVESAQRMARRTGAQVTFSADAEQHYRDQVEAGPPVDTNFTLRSKFRRQFRDLLARLVWGRK